MSSVDLTIRSPNFLLRSKGLQLDMMNTRKNMPDKSFLSLSLSFFYLVLLWPILTDYYNNTRTSHKGIPTHRHFGRFINGLSFSGIHDNLFQSLQLILSEILSGPNEIYNLVETTTIISVLPGRNDYHKVIIQVRIKYISNPMTIKEIGSSLTTCLPPPPFLRKPIPPDKTLINRKIDSIIKASKNF